MNRRIFLTTGAAGLGGLSTLLGLRAVVFSGAPARPSWNETDREVRSAAAIPMPASWSDNAITLAWLGHATVLINFYGVWILTDPVIFPRIGVDLWITTVGMLRHTPCALLPSQLPAIDLVLVSHAHFDHLDTASLASISGRPVAVMASHTADLLPRARYSSVHELTVERFASRQHAARRRRRARD